MTLKVIGHPVSRTARVLWACEEMGLAYELEPAKPRDAQVVALNKTGKVPVIVDGEFVLSDSVAILTYLADREGKLTYPAGTPERGVQDSLMQYINTEIDAALWTYAKHSFVLPEDRRVEAAKATAKWEFERAMAHLAEGFEGPYLGGEMFTIVDIVLSHCAGWGLSRRFDLPGGEFDTFLKSLQKRPARQRVLALSA